MGCCYTTLAHALAATGQAAHRLCLYGIVWGMGLDMGMGMGMGMGVDEDRGTSADSIPVPSSSLHAQPIARPVCRRLSFIKWWSCAYFNMAALNLSGVRSIMTEVGGRTRGACDWGSTDTQRSRDG